MFFHQMVYDMIPSALHICFLLYIHALTAELRVLCHFSLLLEPDLLLICLFKFVVILDLPHPQNGFSPLSE